MTNKNDFTEEEWTQLVRAPMIAGMAISLADPGGPIELTKETLASLRAASSPPSNEELLTAVSHDIMELTQHKMNPMGGYKFEKGSQAGIQILEELSAVNEVVSAKATPEEAQAWRRWMVAVAQAAADAAKEGGFMGFGAELVSQGESDMMTRVAKAVGASG
jgi:hypothetical protein